MGFIPLRVVRYDNTPTTHIAWIVKRVKERQRMKSFALFRTLFQHIELATSVFVERIVLLYGPVSVITAHKTERTEPAETGKRKKNLLLYLSEILRASVIFHTFILVHIRCVFTITVFPRYIFFFHSLLVTIRNTLKWHFHLEELMDEMSNQKKNYVETKKKA